MKHSNFSGLEEERSNADHVLRHNLLNSFAEKKWVRMTSKELLIKLTECFLQDVKVSFCNPLKQTSMSSFTFLFLLHCAIEFSSES